MKWTFRSYNNRLQQTTFEFLGVSRSLLKNDPGPVAFYCTVHVVFVGVGAHFCLFLSLSLFFASARTHTIS